MKLHKFGSLAHLAFEFCYATWIIRIIVLIVIFWGDWQLANVAFVAMSSASNYNLLAGLILIGSLLYLNIGFFYYVITTIWAHFLEDNDQGEHTS